MKPAKENGSSAPTPEPSMSMPIQPRKDLTMKASIQQKAHETVDRRHWTDAMWAESRLPVGASTRLAKVDRALQGISAIDELLWQVLAERQAALADNTQAPKVPIKPWQEEGLKAALMELMAVAEASVQDLRENRHGCCEVHA